MRLDHVGIAVTDAKGAANTFQRLFGLPLNLERTVPDQGVKVVKLASGESFCEFLEPTGPQTPVGKFLSKGNGPLHHVCFAVPDIRAAIKDLVAKGVEMIDREPRIGAAGHPIAFLQPK